MRHFGRQAGTWVWGTLKSLYQRSFYAAGFVGFLLLSWWLLTSLFYGLMPGSFFLNYYQVQMTPAVAGDDVPMTLCRSRHYGDIKAHITRTLYKADDTKGVQLTFREVGSYEEDITVEDGPDCQNLQIKASQFTHTAGMWKFHTDVIFYVEGYRKVTSYDSPVYAILERPTNGELRARLEDQIKGLQQQLDDLKQQVSYVPPAAATTPTGSTARSQDVTTSAPPEPPQAAQQPSASTTPQPQPLLTVPSPSQLLTTLGGI